MFKIESRPADLDPRSTPIDFKVPLKIDGTTVDIPVDILTNDVPSNGDTVLCCASYGQRQMSSALALDRLTAARERPLMYMTTHYNRLPRKMRESRVDVVERFSRDVVPVVLSELIHEDREQDQVGLIAESVGALHIGYALETTNGEGIGNIATSIPAGASNITGEKIDKSDWRFLCRFANALLQTDLVYPGSFRMGLEIVTEIGLDVLKSRTFPAQLHVVNRADVSDAFCRHASQGHGVNFFLGLNDRLFPYADCDTTLQARWQLYAADSQTPVKLHGVPGMGHESPISPLGSAVLLRCLDAV